MIQFDDLKLGDIILLEYSTSTDTDWAISHVFEGRTTSDISGEIYKVSDILTKDGNITEVWDITDKIVSGDTGWKITKWFMNTTNVDDFKNDFPEYFI